MHAVPKGRVLIIAGSDSGGGAGIQGDLKTEHALGGYGMTAITALTAQNTQGVFGIHPVPEDFIAQQITLCLEDIGADTIKTGMLHSAVVIETVTKTLQSSASHCATGSLATGNWQLATPLIVDPVMVAKGGSPLLAAEALDALKTLLLPRATLMTPNLPEAELLLGRTIADADMDSAAQDLLQFGSEAVLLKGGHGHGAVLKDVLVTRDGTTLTLSAQRVQTTSTHGTGCTFASAIATGIAQKLSLQDAVIRAHAYVQDAIARAPGFGKGNGPLGH